MRVLGIDPGSHITGYGVVEKKGAQLLHIDNGCLSIKKSLPFPQKLLEIHVGLTKIIYEFKPDVVAVEDIFFAKNAASALKLGESRGVAILAATQKGLPVYEYPARTVKQAITGYGQASKEQMQKMILHLLRLKEVAQEDASDALAVAICHIHSYKLKDL